MSTSARPTSGSIMRDGLFQSADGTTIVVPGKPEESELLARITADDPLAPHAARPRAAGTSLAEQIDLIKRWIAEGARVERALGLSSADAAGRSGRRPASQARATKSIGSSEPGLPTSSSSRPRRPTGGR